jgi:hypothetical protein
MDAHQAEAELLEEDLVLYVTVLVPMVLETNRVEITAHEATVLLL